MRIKLGTAVGFALLFLVASGASAQVAPPLTYTGGTYSQNFDALPTETFAGYTAAWRGPIDLNTAFSTPSNPVTALVGWMGAEPWGTSQTAEFRAQNGSAASSTGRGIESFGANGSTNRALGVLSTSNQISCFGLVLYNGTGQTLTSYNLSYTGEQWRRGDVSPQDTLQFDYEVSTDSNANLTDPNSWFVEAPAFNFQSPNSTAAENTALDGTAAENQLGISGTITGLDWESGGYLVLRWRGQDLPGQDDALAIDNLSFSAVPEPATMALLICGGVAMLVRSRRRRQ